MNLSPFIQKFGVYKNNIAGSLELFGLVGYGKNHNLLGSNNGLTRHASFYDYTKKDGEFYGIGAMVLLNKIRGDLRKFQNTQNGILLRLSHKQNSFTMNIANDATAKPIAKNGTDKGQTARIMVNFRTIQNKELYGFGLGMDMFTPEADYSRVPRNDTNSDDGMRIVSFNTKPFDNLFHLNLFMAFVYQSNGYNFDGRIGIDNPKTGAYMQNKLHDSFGLYPRFSWPVNQRGKLYTLFDLNKSFYQSFE